MLRKKTICLALSSLCLCSLVLAKHDEQALRNRANKLFEVIPPVPALTSKQKALATLGEKLYHEKALSINQSQSCASCHAVDNFTGVDHQVTSTGALGKIGERNAPTVFNAVHQTAQFWDGRAANLKEQAGGPILNPIEMALPDEKTALERINRIKTYQPLIEFAYNQSSLTEYEQITQALAQYQATLKTNDRFDDWLRGDNQALSTLEKQGLFNFMETGCANCHHGALLGGNSFQKLGAHTPYPDQSDQGRYGLTKNQKDKMYFKVPMLRNVGQTSPYFHDGSQKTLADAVRSMGVYQLGQELSSEKVKSIVAFLRSLDDKQARQ